MPVVTVLRRPALIATSTVRFACRSLTLPSILMLLLAAGCAQQRKPGASGGPGRPPAAVNKYVEGVGAYRAGNRDQAISALEDATRANPKLITARSLLGDLYKARGDYSKAADQYKAV